MTMDVQGSAPARLGKHRLVRRLAVGGMAEVYLAVAEGMAGFEKTVVLKRLHPEHTRDAELLAMFLDEARLMARLRHPNIAEVYDIGHEGGEYFFTMEHVPGEDVREILRFLAGAPLPLPQALTIVVRAATGLGYAHALADSDGRPLGIVHRDVSPSNIIVTPGGVVKLIDFGVAKWAAQRSETRHGTLKGKVAYMSPEQCRAEPLDGRSDVFALGVMLYELTTGVRPFDGASDFEVLNAIVNGTPKPPSAHRAEYPSALEAIVMKALARDRQARHADAGALVAELEGFARASEMALGDEVLATYLRQLLGDKPASWPSTDRVATPSSVAEVRRERPMPDRTQTDVQRNEPPAVVKRRAPVWPFVVGGGALLAVGAVFVMRPVRREPPPPIAALPTPPSPVAAPVVAPPQPSAPPPADEGPVAARTPKRRRDRVAPPEASATPTPTSIPTSTPAPAPKPEDAWDIDSPVLPK